MDIRIYEQAINDNFKAYNKEKLSQYDFVNNVLNLVSVCFEDRNYILDNPIIRLAKIYSKNFL